MLWWTFVSHLGIAGHGRRHGAVADGGVRGVPGRGVPLGAVRRPRPGRAGCGASPPGPRPRHAVHTPFVSLQVPAYNEPPEMVIETLQSLTALDYPAYEIIVIDDNTDDESLWRPVEAWCREHGVKFVHLSDWPGYKSGALNYALREHDRPPHRADRRDRRRLPARRRTSCAPVRRCSPTRRSASSRRRRTTATGSRRRSTAGSTTPTSTSSRSPSRPATSATARSSPARWG